MNDQIFKNHTYQTKTYYSLFCFLLLQTSKIIIPFLGLVGEANIKSMSLILQPSVLPTVPIQSSLKLL